MIKSINRNYSTIKIRPKKSSKPKPSKVTQKNEVDQSIKDKYLLQTFETNIKSLKNQVVALQDEIFKLRKENSLKENQIYAQKKFLTDKEKKINKRQIAIFPYSSYYHKALLENEKVKQENANLSQEINKMQQELVNRYDELEEINSKGYFNSKDTFEVQQLEKYNVEILQSKIHFLSTNCSCSQQKIGEYQQMLKEYNMQEKDIQKSIDDTIDHLYKLHDRKTELKIISEIENSELEDQSLYVEYLESEVKSIEDLISSASEKIEDEVNKARIDYENFLSEIDEKKKYIIQKKKSVLLNRDPPQLDINEYLFNSKSESKIEENEHFSEDDLNDYRKIVEKIYDQLSNRGDAIKNLNVQFQTKQVKNSTIKSRIEGNWRTKVRKVDFLKAKYLSIQKSKEEILFQSNKISDLREKSQRINSLLNRALNREKNAQIAIKHNEEKLLKLYDQGKEIDQKEKCLFDQQEKLKEKNDQLIQKEKNVNSIEQQAQIREKNIKRMEEEAQMLKDKLENQMKHFENELLVTPFHEKIGLTA